jgi:uncharacterized membrane protein (Fun14 family)
MNPGVAILLGFIVGWACRDFVSRIIHRPRRKR